MTFEKTYDIQKGNRLVINLSDRFRSRKKVRVTIEDVDDHRSKKIEILKRASEDPLSLSDIHEVSTDFKDSDSELL